MSNWTGLGIGTKNSDGDWIEMFFAEENISSEDLMLLMLLLKKSLSVMTKLLLLYQKPI
jgi:hypothetical protein